MTLLSFSIDEGTELMKYFLNLPQFLEIHNPINMINIFNHQQANESLIQTQKQNPAQLPIHMINGMNIISVFLDSQQPTL